MIWGVYEELNSTGCEVVPRDRRPYEMCPKPPCLPIITENHCSSLGEPRPGHFRPHRMAEV